MVLIHNQIIGTCNITNQAAARGPFNLFFLQENWWWIKRPSMVMQNSKMLNWQILRRKVDIIAAG